MNNPSEGSESKRDFVYQGYMGTSCVFVCSTESRVGVRDIISYDNISSITFAYIYGAVNRTDEKTEKSLIKSGILDKQNGNVCLIDFIYFLWMLPPQLAATFGEVATFHADTVHIIGDAYSNEPTINDSKRDRRENTEATYTPFKDAIKPVQHISTVHFCLRRSSLHCLTSLPTKLGSSITNIL